MTSRSSDRFLAARVVNADRAVKAHWPTVRSAPQKNGVILWEGPSALDGSPIVVIATGLTAASANLKTGALVQTFVLCADVHPSEALKTGKDGAICGDCVHRPGPDGKRSCYVRMDGPASVWRCYRAGGYRRAQASDWAKLATMPVRAGTYGDPAACPLFVWQRLRPATGYTHQWRRPEFAGLRALVMASADSPEDRRDAVAGRWRTFRVRPFGAPLMPGEFACPAAEESGKRMTCDRCRACGGNPSDRSRAASPSILVHGTGARVGNARLQVMA